MRQVDTYAPTAIVIGSGLSGLAAARSLKERGIFVQILEKTLAVGDTWRRRHPRLRLNTHRRLSGLPGRDMPRSAGAFPARDDVVSYLEDYAHHIDVPIRFGVTVNRVDPGERSWRLETSEGVLEADHVVVATGRDRLPRMPAWPGMDRFTGEILHGSAFGDADRYRDRKVLVVGAGNSGTDILNHLAAVDTARVWVSVRHGPVIFPTRLAGVPIQRLSPVLERLPATAVDRLLDVTERIAFGNLRKWGLRKHPAGGATRLLGDGTAPGIDNGFVRSLKAGRVKVVPEVEAFDEESVRLAGGKVVDPDVVICATGYRTGLEPMLGHLGVLDHRGVPVIDGAEQDPRYPGLWCTGMRPRLIGMFLTARHNAAGIADAVASPRGGGADPDARIDAALPRPEVVS